MCIQHDAEFTTVQSLLAPLMLLMGMVGMCWAHNLWMTFAGHQKGDWLHLDTTTG